MAPAKEATENPKEEEQENEERADPETKDEEKEEEEEEKGPPAFKETELFKALVGPLSQETLKAVQDILDGGADLDAVGTFQESYLHVLLAPRDKNDRVVTEKTADEPEEENDESEEDQAKAIQEEIKREARRSRVIAALIYQLAAAGMKMNKKDQEGNTALHIAAVNDQPPVVMAALIQTGLDPCLINASEEDATDLAVLPQIKKTLDFYDPGLWRACSENELKKTSLLLSAWCKIEVHEEDDEEETLMTMVNDKEHFDIVVALKSHMKNIKLIHAALAGKHEQVKDLVEVEGVDVNIMNKGYFEVDGKRIDMPLLGELVLFGRNDSAKLLVKKGADVNVKMKLDKDVEEPLFYYLLQRCDDPLPVDVFKLILKRADFSLVKSKYFSIWQMAWERKFDSELVGVMVSRGLNVGVRNDLGYNIRDIIVRDSCNFEETERKQALYFVDEHLLDMAMEGRLKELLDLASSGYSYMLITNRKGKSIIKFAEKEDQNDIVKFLEAYPTFKKNGYKVYNAILKGNMAEVRDTMDNIIAAVCDCLGRSPLQLAVLYERRYIIKWLLKKHPKSTQALDQYGRSVLHYSYMIPDGDDILQQLIEAVKETKLHDFMDSMGKLPSDYKNQPDKRMLESERLRACGIDTLTLDRYLTLRDCIIAEKSEVAIEVIDKIVEFHPRNLMDLPSMFPDLVYTDLLFLCTKHKQDDIAIALIKAGVPYNHTSQVAKEDESTEVMNVRKAAEHHGCEKLVKFLDEYKPEPAEYESRNGHLALAAAMALADSNSEFNSPRGSSTPESDISLPESPRPDTARTNPTSSAGDSPPDVKNSSSCTIL